MADLSGELLDDVRTLTRLSIAEDLGDVGDVTSIVTIPQHAVGRGTFVQKAAGVPAGLPLVAAVAAEFSDRLRITGDPADREGVYADETPRPLLGIEGPLRDLLAAERTILNFLTHLGGVATLTRRFADRCAGTRAKVYDTRKTLPGYRRLQKYAVRAGGGANHRMGLHDMVLVKDNHLASLSPAADLRGRLADAVARAAALGETSGTRIPIEVEVDTLDQLAEVLDVAGVDVILLDNMPPDMMRRAVAMRDDAGSPAELEASGNVTLETVAEVAATGVERIAVGALTHSAPALDVGLDLVTDAR